MRAQKVRFFAWLSWFGVSKYWNWKVVTELKELTNHTLIAMALIAFIIKRWSVISLNNVKTISIYVYDGNVSRLFVCIWRIKNWEREYLLKEFGRVGNYGTKF